MMYMCKQIKKESIVTMYDERVAELEHLLEVANKEIATHESMKDFATQRYNDDTNMLANVLYFIVDSCNISREQLSDAIENSSYEADRVRRTLEFHDAIPDGLMYREYCVSVTVPVTVHLTLEAIDADEAEEKAQDELDSSGLEVYQMEYNVYYDADYHVEEV